MAKQFDIVENLDAPSRNAYPYLIILQHNRAETVSTIVAAPLAPANRTVENPRLHPLIEVRGERYAVYVAQLAAIQKNTIGRVIGSAEANYYEIVAALDMLFTGI